MKFEKGKMLCPKCGGKVLFNKNFTITNFNTKEKLIVPYRELCDKCNGYRKLDWVDNLTIINTNKIGWILLNGIKNKISFIPWFIDTEKSGNNSYIYKDETNDFLKKIICSKNKLILYKIKCDMKYSICIEDLLSYKFLEQDIVKFKLDPSKLDMGISIVLGEFFYVYE